MNDFERNKTKLLKSLQGICEEFQKNSEEFLRFEVVWKVFMKFYVKIDNIRVKSFYSRKQKAL